MVIKTDICWLTAESSAKTLVPTAILAAKSSLRLVDRPHAVNNTRCKSAAIVVGTAELLTSENAKLQEDKKHKEQSVEKLRYRTKQSLYKSSQPRELSNTF